MVDFDTGPDRYRHWRLEVQPPLATLTLDIDEATGLKLNSYDLSVDIELYDAVCRLRYEHPGVGAVIVTSGKDRIFSAGANIPTLAGSSHGDKVNFCKFTNETRLAIEESPQAYIAAINGTASGGGYELALACDWIMLVDDGSSAVSLPEVPLLAVLPGTGGLTRLTDKRCVRRDRADAFCTLAEGVKGRRALDWNLVDEVVPRSSFADAVQERALDLASSSARPRSVSEPLPAFSGDRVTLDGNTLTVTGPPDFAAARQLDGALLRLRHHEPENGVIVLRAEGPPATGPAHPYWTTALQRVDQTARTFCTLIDEGTCFEGALFELALAADRSFMLDADGVTIALSDANFGSHPMVHGRTRLENRFQRPVDDMRGLAGQRLGPKEAAEHGLVSEIPDDIDWEDEVRLFLEERASFSPDALTAMEANLRYGGPENMAAKVFGRLSAWQNWVFQRPNATGEAGALRRYGTGQRPEFDRRRT